MTGRDRHADRDHHDDDVAELGVGLLTVSSSRAAAADPDDPGGDAVAAALADHGHAVVARDLVGDDFAAVRTAVAELCGDPDVDAVVTTGGTGVSVDDVTVDAVSGLFETELPGFGEAFRRRSAEAVGTRALVTRATAGLIARTPVFCLPGSADAAGFGTRELVVEIAPHVVGVATRHRDD